MALWLAFTACGGCRVLGLQADRGKGRLKSVKRQDARADTPSRDTYEPELRNSADSFYFESAAMFT